MAEGRCKYKAHPCTAFKSWAPSHIASAALNGSKITRVHFLKLIDNFNNVLWMLPGFYLSVSNLLYTHFESLDR